MTSIAIPASGDWICRGKKCDAYVPEFKRSGYQFPVNVDVRAEPTDTDSV